MSRLLDNSAASSVERSWRRYLAPTVRYGYPASRNGARNAGARYPGVSSAWSSDPMSCWWQSTDAAGVVRLCSTQGFTLIGLAQQQLMSSGRVLSVDHNFGPESLRAVIDWLPTVAADATFVDQVRADYARLTLNDVTRPAMRGVPVSFPTMQAIIWIATAPDQQLVSLNVPRTIEAVRFATAAPDDGAAGGDVSCAPMSSIAGTGAGTGAVASGGPAAAGGTAAAGSSLLVFVAGFAALALLASGKSTKAKG